jgi:nicotinamidase/pyrazinamidase
MAKIGWIVDVQVDFMDPQGRLYVKDLGSDEDPGAVQIVGTLEEAAAWMHESCDAVVFTGDWHSYDDAEIDAENPDPLKGTYPPHCMGRSPDPDERAGAEIIFELRPDDPLILEIGAGAEGAEAVAREAVAQGRPIFIQKNRFDVFEGNDATEALIAGLEKALRRPLEFYVMGVARDVCVTQAIDGLQARDHQVRALKDATWGLGLEPEEETLGRWSERGEVITVAELPGA